MWRNGSWCLQHDKARLRAPKFLHATTVVTPPSSFQIFWTTPSNVGATQNEVWSLACTRKLKFKDVQK